MKQKPTNELATLQEYVRERYPNMSEEKQNKLARQMVRNRRRLDRKCEKIISYAKGVRYV